MAPLNGTAPTWLRSTGCMLTCIVGGDEVPGDEVIDVAGHLRTGGDWNRHCHVASLMEVPAVCDAYAQPASKASLRTENVNKREMRNLIKARVGTDCRTGVDFVRVLESLKPAARRGEVGALVAGDEHLEVRVQPRTHPLSHTHTDSLTSARQ